MRRILAILMILVSFGKVSANNGFVCEFRKIIFVKGGSIGNKAPSHDMPITFFYDNLSNRFVVSFYVRVDNAEIIIIKDGEKLASDVFSVNEDEGIECNMSECEKGEYVVYVVTDGAMQVWGSFYKE